MNNLVIGGVDIGGSHITAATVDMSNGDLIAGSWQRQDVFSRGSAEDIISTWGNVIRKSLSVHINPPKRIGIAMPGPFNYEEGICLIKDQYKYDDLFGLNIKKLLAAELAMMPSQLFFFNDAECFLRGEVFSGAGKGYRKVIGITLGTGLGSAYFSNGKAMDADLWCQPFKGGIAEDYLSTRWFTRRYFELSNREVPNVKELVSQPEKEWLTIVFKEFAENLAQFLLPVVEREKAEMIVIGGNIAQVFHLFEDHLQSFFSRHRTLVTVSKAILGEQASLIGAASACRQESFA